MRLRGPGVEDEWKRRTHMRYVRDVEGVDQLFLRTFVGEEMGEEDGEGFVLKRHEEAFKVLQREVEKYWRPNEEISLLVDELEKRLSINTRRSSIGAHVR